MMMMIDNNKPFSMKLMHAMWKATGALILLGVVLHLAIDFPLSLVAFSLWLLMAFLPGM
jgi:hypothetical protein